MVVGQTKYANGLNNILALKVIALILMMAILIKLIFPPKKAADALTWVAGWNISKTVGIYIMYPSGKDVKGRPFQNAFKDEWMNFLSITFIQCEPIGCFTASCTCQQQSEVLYWCKDTRQA